MKILVMGVLGYELDSMRHDTTMIGQVEFGFYYLNFYVCCRCVLFISFLLTAIVFLHCFLYMPCYNFNVCCSEITKCK